MMLLIIEFTFSINSIFVKLLILERLIERELEEEGEETSFFARKEKNDCLFR